MEAYSTIVFEDGDDDLRFQVANNKGAVLMSMGNFDDCLSAFEQALSMKPDHIEAIHNKACALRALRRFDEALEAFERCVTETPDFYSAICGKAEVLTSLARYEDAELCCNQAVELLPENPRAFAARGLARLKLLNPVDAVSDLEKAVSLGDLGDDTKRILSLGMALKADQLLTQGEHEQALQLYDESIELSESGEPSENVLFNISMARLRTGDKDKAKEGLRRVMEMNENHFQAISALGIIYLQDSDFVSAGGLLAEASKLEPENREISYNLGVCYLNLRKLDKASNIFREIVKDDPTNELASKALETVEGQLAFNAAYNTASTESIAQEMARKNESKSTSKSDDTKGGVEDKKEIEVTKETEPTKEEEKKEEEVAPQLETVTPTPTTTSSVSTQDVSSLESDSKSQTLTCMTFPYEELKSSPFPPEVNPEKREMHLSDEEFESLFSMSKEVYYF